MTKLLKPTFFDYLIASATFLVIIMFCYPLYNQNLVGLALFVPLALAAAVIIFRLLTKKSRKRRKILQENFPEAWKQILEDNVKFYRNLDPSKKEQFERDVYLFLAEKRVTGIATTVDDLDRLLVASSAIIPIFSFPNWEYTQLDEVLIYPGAFNHSFETAGDDTTIAGMVGNGIMNGKMILSKKDLHYGFKHPHHKKNVGIHEFVHLLDQSDGSIDGVPDVLLQHKYAAPWLRMMHQEMKKIKTKKSDIDLYGALSEEEFLPVAAEYFFQKPEQFKQNHPKLYRMLNRIFRQDPVF